MRPRGPLPPRIYWTRRLLIIGIAVVVSALLWWLMAGGRSGQASADQQPGHPTGQQTPKVPPTTPAPDDPGRHDLAGGVRLDPARLPPDRSSAGAPVAATRPAG